MTRSIHLTTYLNIFVYCIMHLRHYRLPRGNPCIQCGQTPPQLGSASPPQQTHFLYSFTISNLKISLYLNMVTKVTWFKKVQSLPWIHFRLLSSVLFSSTQTFSWYSNKMNKLNVYFIKWTNLNVLVSMNFSNFN